MEKKDEKGGKTSEMRILRQKHLFHRFFSKKRKSYFFRDFVSEIRLDKDFFSIFGLINIDFRIVSFSEQTSKNLQLQWNSAITNSVITSSVITNKNFGHKWTIAIFNQVITGLGYDDEQIVTAPSSTLKPSLPLLKLIWNMKFVFFVHWNTKIGLWV